MTRSVRAGSSSQRARELESVHGELVGALAALKQAHALGGLRAFIGDTSFGNPTVATLRQAVRVMARVQLGKRLSGEQTRAIVSFLDSLTGPLPADFVAPPALPVGPYRETR